MSAAPLAGWHTANQRYLQAALGVVRAALERVLQREAGAEADTEGTARRALDEAEAAMPAPPALLTLCATFGLSDFERDVLLLCAGIELDASFAGLCAAVQDDPSRRYATWSLALSALPGAHWSALAPTAPLRYWRLVEVGGGSALTTSPLRVDESALHYLAGLEHRDERLIGLVEPLRGTIDLVPSQYEAAERIVALWTRAANAPALPGVQVCGGEPAAKRAIAAAACAALGLNLHVMAADLVPTDAMALEALIRLWERESALGVGALLVEACDTDGTDAARTHALARLVERTRGPLIVACRERKQFQRQTIAFDVARPSAAEQHALWQRAIGDVAQDLNGHVAALVSTFDLSAEIIQAATTEALSRARAGAAGERSFQNLEGALWDACRGQGRPRLDDLAQRIEPAAGWDELVLPEAQCEILREIAAHVRQRATVYETWGFAARGSRGLGISALFAGASGTGKTMAAEVLANELRLDLYRIDLSSVVSKYIGDTEKNLRRVFDAAEAGGAILLFDEADALFGKRSEVKDSHDRYANIEVSYLLQRMEAYRGLAILTTNMKSALDTAFLRRIRFVVQFPFPDAVQRAEIWRHIFPAATPTQGLDAARLARLNIAGGNIRNIALNAAFLAADAGMPVCMAHLLRAARGEYAKLEMPLTEAEIGGWV